MEYENIRFKKKARTAIVTLYRPEALNALNVPLCMEVRDALNRCTWEDKIRAVILTGSGKAFCAGGDIHALREYMKKYPRNDPGRKIQEIVSVFHSVILAIRKLKKPVIGALNGTCSGGGAGLALACDILIGTEHARFHMAYALIGQAVDGGSSLFLTESVGRNRTAELLFTGGALDARKAHQLGILNRLVSPENLLSEAERLAERLASGPAFALGMAKDLLNRAGTASLETQLEREKEAVIKCAGTGEFGEGMRAFFEKRKPDFMDL